MTTWKRRRPRILDSRLLVAIFFLVSAIHPEAPWFYVWRTIYFVLSVLYFIGWRKSLQKPVQAESQSETGHVRAAT
jgi:hypothetical protein